MARLIRPAQTLRDASEHLDYEIWMFDETAKKLDGMPSGMSRNAVLESFTVHARALYQFFDPSPPPKGPGRQPREPRPDDVVAWDYVPDRATWETCRGAMPVELSEVVDRVGKEIAHLTYHRADTGPIAKDWNITAIHAAILKLVRTFAVTAVPANLSDKLKATVAKLALTPTPGTIFSTSSATNAVQVTEVKVNSVTSNTSSAPTTVTTLKLP